MKIYDLVKKLLEENKPARNSDKHLIWLVYEANGLVTKNGVRDCLNHYNFFRGPSFESITRARRAVQKQHAHLRPDAPIEQARKLKENSRGTFVYREKL